VLSPIELDAYAQAMASQTKADECLDLAYRQQLERLRYEAALAERQFNRVDPDNRLVAAELETRWETALRVLKQSEMTYTQRQQMRPPPPELPEDVKKAFTAIGQKLPQI
jgi:hypothetical protein